MNKDIAIKAIVKELENAEEKFKPFNSAHEGWAVLMEEVDELWDEVKGHYGPERDQRMAEEAIQVGAMALRFLLMLSVECPECRGDGQFPLGQAAIFIGLKGEPCPLCQKQN